MQRVVVQTKDGTEFQGAQVETVLRGRNAVERLVQAIAASSPGEGIFVDIGSDCWVRAAEIVAIWTEPVP
jgi:hypothetical protein